MGYENASESTIRTNIYNTIFTLINTYKLTGWTVLSSFPVKQPVFPCIVINPANVTIRKLGFQIGARINAAEVIIEMYSPASDRKESLDLMRDKLQQTFIDHESDVLFAYKLILDGEEPFIDSDVDTVEFNRQELNTASIAVNFTIR